jgi:Protein of unknown function (DUF4232)
MRPARTILAVVLAAAAATGCTAQSSAVRPATPAPATAPSPTPPSTSSGGQPATGRCQASALRGSIQGTEGAAGTLWTTVRLRNASGRTCTVKGIPGVRLLGADGSPVTAPSVPDGPGGSLVTLKPGQAATFAYAEPNVCDSTVSGSRIRVTLPKGQGSLTVALGAEAKYGTCARVRVQAIQRAPA